MVYQMTTITRQRIFDAAESLLQEGKRPTQQLVRERIGSGSLTTINRALNEWWESLSQRLSQQNQGYDLPEPVIRHSNRLWNESLGYARREYLRQVELIEAETEKLRQDSLSERQEYARQIKELSDILGQQQKKATRLEAELLETKESLSQAQEEYFLLSRDQSRISQVGGNEELLQAQARIQVQQEHIQALTDKNQKLISENAELRLKLKQNQP